MIDQYRHQWMLRRHQGLMEDRRDFDPHVKEIIRNLLPRLGRFSVTERNRGGEMNQSIIDSTGTRAHRVLAAGMMAGMTSPARPWFKLGIPDSDLAKNHAVRKWLFDCTSVLQRVFNKSNTYQMLQSTYRELGGFGTAFNVVVDDFDNVIHNHPMTYGQYALGLDDRGFVDSASREIELTVEQAARMFGLANLSVSQRNAYDRGNYTTPVQILHIIEPRPVGERNRSKKDARNMAYRSVYAELGNSNKKLMGEDYLKESGFRFFPGLGPRWDLLFNDTYGSSPAMEALGDLRQLQQQQFMKAKAIDFQADPPVQVPVNMQAAQLVPGGVVTYDGAVPQGGVRAAYEVPLRIDHLLGDIADVQRRIDSCFYVDMFLMLAASDRGQMTATEVAERHEEKLLMLGPVLERLHNELLSPLISSTFTRCVEAGILPPAPEEMGGMPLDIEFVSVLAQAQKAVAINSVDRLIGHIGVLANVKPEVVDKLNADKSIDLYSDALGIDPDLIVADDAVALVRQERAQAQAAAQAAEQAKTAADALGRLGSVPTGGGPASNAGADVLGLFSGYQSPTPLEAGL